MRVAGSANRLCIFRDTYGDEGMATRDRDSFFVLLWFSPSKQKTLLASRSTIPLAGLDAGE